MHDAIYRHCLKKIEDANGVPIKLETERELAEWFGVSRWVTRRVLQRLVRDGLAVARPGRGYFARLSTGRTGIDHMTVGIVYEPDGANGVVDPRYQEREVGMLVNKIRDRSMCGKLLPIQGDQGAAAIRRAIDEHPMNAYVLVWLPPAIQDFFAAYGRPAIVWGGTYEDLGLPCVGPNRLDSTRELTEQLLANGHRRVCLVYECGSYVAVDRTRAGFEYAHHVRETRFKRERIIRVERRKRGLRTAMKRLFALSPTAMLVSENHLLRRLYDISDDAFRNKLADMDIIILNPDYEERGPLPVKVVDVDEALLVRTIAQLLVDVSNGQPLRRRHYEIPWKLVTNP